MARTRVTVIGALHYSQESGLKIMPPSVREEEVPPENVFEADEVLPNVRDWPGLGKYPEPPKYVSFRDLDEYHRHRMEMKGTQPRPWKDLLFGPVLSKKERDALERESSKRELDALWEKWIRDCVVYDNALHADPAYRQAAVDFLEHQRREPQPIRKHRWAYKDKVLMVESSSEPEPLNKDQESLLVRHFVLRRTRDYEKLRREVESLENMERLQGTSREPIPESVRLFVWRRDKGQCVKCGSRERLEFDHIIPIAAGGSNTERNIQLLCESCNRSKGAAI